MKQPVIYVEDTTIEDKLVGIIFCLFIMFTMLVFFSRYLILEETAPIVITDAQSDLLANKSKLPEGFDNQIIVTTGDDYLNPNNLTLKSLESLTGLQECSEGECAIDLKTGIKRCPQNNNSRIVYNRAFEGCTAKFFCTEESLPYAIRSSGETDTFGVCDSGVECRCSSQITCPKYVVSSFNLYNGSSYTGLRKDLNYYFDQTTLDDNKIIGYDSIIIPQERTNVQFCNINPSYLNRLSGGCNFTNGDNDILKCDQSNDFFAISGAEFNQIGVNFPIGFQNTPSNNFKTLGYQNTLNIGKGNQSEARKPDKGYSQYFDTNTDTIRIVSYQQNNKNAETINQNTLSSLAGVFSWGFDTTVVGGNITSDVGVPNQLAGIDSADSDSNVLSFMEVIYTGCSGVSGVDVSNKNMLLCLQNDVQPCKEGIFAYRVDTKPASQFCQYNPSLEEYIKNSGDFIKSYTKGPNPLDDSQLFTLSCVIGPGCNGSYNQSFCKNGNCDTAIDRYKNIFQDYDDSAVNGIWELRQIDADDPAEPGVISFSYDSSKGIVLRNNGMITIEPGDYFSTVRNLFQKLLVKAVTIPSSPTSIVFYLGSVDGLEVGYSIYAPGFKGTITIIDKTNNKVTIGSDYFASVTSIPIYTLVDGYKSVQSSGDGNDFGIFIIIGGKILPAALDGTLSTFSDGVPDTIFLYKQFGFNGLNYNSEINFTYTTPEKGSPYFTTKRKYNTLSQWYYWLAQYQSNIDDLLLVPLSSAVVPIVIQTEIKASSDSSSKRINRESINAVVFSNPSADFKEDLSFYYPVWDQNKNTQTCIKCKPALYTYVKINQNSQVSSAVIQFSGRDFGQYMYYPQFDFDSSNKYTTNYNKSPFIFNIMAVISQDTNVISTTRRIILQNPSPNIPYSSDVDSDYYTTNPYYVLDSNNTINRTFSPVQDGTKFPLSGKPSSITLNFIPVDDQNILLDDCYIPFTFGGRVLLPNSTQQISLDYTGQKYTNFNILPDSNWFAGKKYFAGQNMILVKSQVRIVSVQLINGKQVIFTDSTTNIPISSTVNSEQDPSIIQIYSENDTLDLGFDQDVNTQQVMPNNITNQRITSLVFPNNVNVIKNIAALPSIIFTKYRNLQ